MRARFGVLVVVAVVALVMPACDLERILLRLGPSYPPHPLAVFGVTPADVRSIEFQAITDCHTGRRVTLRKLDCPEEVREVALLLTECSRYVKWMGEPLQDHERFRAVFGAGNRPPLHLIYYDHNGKRDADIIYAWVGSSVDYRNTEYECPAFGAWARKNFPVAASACGGRGSSDAGCPATQPASALPDAAPGDGPADAGAD
jgi:hypothetical protein